MRYFVALRVLFVSCVLYGLCIVHVPTKSSGLTPCQEELVEWDVPIMLLDKVATLMEPMSRGASEDSFFNWAYRGVLDHASKKSRFQGIASFCTETVFSFEPKDRTGVYYSLYMQYLRLVNPNTVYKCFALEECLKSEANVAFYEAIFISALLYEMCYSIGLFAALYQILWRRGRPPNCGDEPVNEGIAFPAPPIATQPTKSSAEHEAENLVPRKSQSSGTLTSNMAGELDFGQSEIPAGAMTGKAVVAKRSSSDTILHQGRSQTAVDPEDFVQLRETWQNKANLVPAGTWNWY